MLNLNEEYTYYKEKDFVNYCLGVFRHNEEHDTYEDMNVYCSDMYGMQRFAIDYCNEKERESLSKKIFKQIKNDEHAYRMSRIDFDFRMVNSEQESFENDWDIIRTLFDVYCREHKLFGYIFTHFSQLNPEDSVLLLTKHVHILYQEPFVGPTFSEYLHQHL